MLGVEISNSILSLLLLVLGFFVVFFIIFISMSSYSGIKLIRVIRKIWKNTRINHFKLFLRKVSNLRFMFGCYLVLILSIYIYINLYQSISICLFTLSIYQITWYVFFLDACLVASIFTLVVYEGIGK